MSEELPEALRDPQAVLERGALLNELLEQRNEAHRLLRYMLTYSHARALLSDAYIEDVKRALASGQVIGIGLGRLEKAEALLNRVLDDVNFGVGLSQDIRAFLDSQRLGSTADGGSEL